MSYFEYIFSGDLTTELEEKTLKLTNLITNGFVPFSLIKYYDEVITDSDKKRRTFIFASPINMGQYIYSNYFNNNNMEMIIYYKQRLV